MAKAKKSLASEIDSLDKKFDAMDKKAADYKSAKEAATIEFLGKHATLKVGDNILLTINASKQTVRLNVKSVSLGKTLSDKSDIIYRFNDDSFLSHSELESDKYDWTDEKETIADEIIEDEPEAAAAE